MNVAAQRVERELRDELADSVSQAASDADRARVGELEKNEAELRIEVSKYVCQCTRLKMNDLYSYRERYVIIASYILILYVFTLVWSHR